MLKNVVNKPVLSAHAKHDLYEPSGYEHSVEAPPCNISDRGTVSLCDHSL